MKNQENQGIGFIGQGWIGKHYADDFEKRGYAVTRYSLESPYANNKEKISQCDIVFIAVPTPTRPDGFDGTIVRQAVKLVGKGKIAVIKSTMLPGATESIQKENPNVFVIHSPEFLSTSTAAEDAAQPKRNIIGIPIHNEIYLQKANEVLAVLPKAPYNKICSSREAELIKYGRNCLGYVRVVFANLLYDLAKKLDIEWSVVQEAMSADPDNGPRYMNPVHKSGRGAGGPCFIKDFKALALLYHEVVGDELGDKMLRQVELKNIELLQSTNKDLDIVRSVYGSRGSSRGTV